MIVTQERHAVGTRSEQDEAVANGGVFDFGRKALLVPVGRRRGVVKRDLGGGLESSQDWRWRACSSCSLTANCTPRINWRSASTGEKDRLQPHVIDSAG